MSATLEKKFSTVYEYLKEDPEKNLSGNFGKAISKPYTIVGLEGIEEKLKTKFEKGRKEVPPSAPKTKPDEAVSLVMKEHYGKSHMEAERIKAEHQESMAAENCIGDLLERYLASVLESSGWVWCSGEFVRAVDFIKKDGEEWRLLQVKNRSNTENSSSKKIRAGTKIEKWCRIDAYTGKTFWDTFPDDEIKSKLSEDGFQKFCINYLKSFRQ